MTVLIHTVSDYNVLDGCSTHLFIVSIHHPLPSRPSEFQFLFLKPHHGLVQLIQIDPKFHLSALSEAWESQKRKLPQRSSAQALAFLGYFE